MCLSVCVCMCVCLSVFAVHATCMFEVNLSTVYEVTWSTGPLLNIPVTCTIVSAFLSCFVGGRSFFIANTSKLLKTAQLYQFQAETSQDKERLVMLC